MWAGPGPGGGRAVGAAGAAGAARARLALGVAAVLLLSASGVAAASPPIQPGPAGAAIVGAARAGGGSPRQSGTAPAVASSQQAGWSEVPVASVAGDSGVQLNDVSCVSVLDCTAVGTAGGPQAPSSPLIEHWDGGQWQLATPAASTGTLESVSCPSASDCMAVGSGAELWNGRVWASTPPPIADGVLNSVSCLAGGACTAVGDHLAGGHFQPVIEAWDGTSWTAEVPPGAPGEDEYLYSVSCSSAAACVAVGFADEGSSSATVALGWNGASWSRLPTPDPSTYANYLYGVSCTSGSACVAVGSDLSGGAYDSLALSWDGSAWSQMSSPDRSAQINSLYGVACATSSDCSAVGEAGGTLVLHWDGVTWSVAPSPSPGALSALYGVACTTACLGVGTSSAGGPSGATSFDPLGEVSSPQPQVSSVSPAAGPLAGGGQVTVSGSGLSGVSAVSFGSVPASSFRVASDGELLATVPAGSSPGFVGVRVSGPDGASVVGPQAEYEYQSPLPYHPTVPTRIADTRSSSGLPYAGHPVTPGSPLELGVTGGTVPSYATAVVLNLTEADATQDSYLTAFPGGTQLPASSSLNFPAGQVRSNLVEVGLGVGGTVWIANAAGSADVVVDLEGYVAPGPGSSGFSPLPAARIADTRAGSGQPDAGRTLGPGESLAVAVTGVGGVPSSGVSAVELNLTATDVSAPSYLTAYPTGASRPLASVTNVSPGQTVASDVIVPVGSDGTVSLYNAVGSLQLVVDVIGWFGPSAASQYVPMPPRRALDTRSGAGELPSGPAPIGPGGVVSVKVAGTGGVPPGADAVVVNLTEADSSAASYLSVYATGGARGISSELNFAAGSLTANLVVVPVGDGGEISIYNASGYTDAVVDVMGWYQ